MTLKRDTHGTRECYRYSGCRCDACREASAAYHREWRETADRSTIKHGNRYGYRMGCRCDPCTRAMSEGYAAMRNREPSKYQAKNRKYLYGISEEQYQSMLSAQHGVCAICGREETAKGKTCLSVDHCHTTGEIRGLLCMSCNRGIGYLADDPTRIRAAAAYLEKHNGPRHAHSWSAKEGRRTPDRKPRRPDVAALQLCEDPSQVTIR